MERLGNILTAAKLFSQFRVRHLGMAFFWACSLLLFRTSIFMPNEGDIALISTTTIVFALTFNLATLIVLALLEYFRHGFVRTLSSWVFACLLVAGIAVMSLNGAATTETLSLDLLIVGCVLVGISFGYFWVAWSQVFAHLHPNITSIGLPITFIATVLIYLLVPELMHLTNLPAWVFMAPLPFLSCVCLAACRRAPEYEAGENTTENLTEALFSLRDILTSAIIFAFLFGFLWETSVLNLSSIDEAHHLPNIIAVIVATLFFLVTTLGRRKWDTDLLYTYGVPLVVISFAFLPLMFSTNILYAYSVMDSGFSILEILALVLVASVTYDLRVCGAIVGAIVRASFLVFRVAGIVAAYFIQTLAIQSRISSAFFSILAIVAIWLWLLLTRRDKESEDAKEPQTSFIDRYGRDIEHIDDDENTVTIGSAIRRWATNLNPAPADKAASSENLALSEAPSPGIPTQESTRVAGAPQQTVQEPAFDANVLNLSTVSRSLSGEDASMLNEIAPVLERYCHAVSEEFGLSRREAEVLPYLALGRSALFIADALYISEHTVRTHIKHILEKTGAPSKQGITDFVYEQGSKLAG